MTPRSMTMTGQETPAEAEAKIRAFVLEIQVEALEDYAALLVGDGATPDELESGLARYRNELSAMREKTLARVREMLEHGGASVH